jgi:F5/8 type C domain
VASDSYAYQTNDATIETPFVPFPMQTGVVGVRVQVEDANLEWGHFVTDGLYVASVPMDGSATTTPAVSSGGPASGLLANGVTANGYESGSDPSFPQYLTLSYSSPVSVDGVGLSSNYGQGQGVTQFNVQVTTDGTDWTTVASDSYAYQTNDATIETPFVPFPMQTGVVGVRVQVEDANLEWSHFVTDGIYAAGAP